MSRTIEAFSLREDARGVVREIQWTEHLGNGRRHRVELLEGGLVARGAIAFRGGWACEIELRRASTAEPFALGCAPPPFRDAVGILRDIETGGNASGFRTALTLPG
jgi:hypothetical protein